MRGVLGLGLEVPEDDEKPEYEGDIEGGGGIIDTEEISNVIGWFQDDSVVPKRR